MVIPCLQLTQHARDRVLLEKIKKATGVGKIYKGGFQSLLFKVSSQEELKLIEEHFNKFPLKSKKKADYELFIKVLEIIRRKQHLTLEGLYQIVAIKASMNQGLSDKLKLAFPAAAADVVPVERPVVELPKTINPH